MEKGYSHDWGSAEAGRWSSLMGKDFVLQVSLYNDIVVEQSMVSSGVCDRLSRLGASGQSVASVVSECGFGEVQVIDLGLCDNTQYLLSSCNPAISFAAEPEFVSYWSGVRRAINNI